MPDSCGSPTSLLSWYQEISPKKVWIFWWKTRLLWIARLLTLLISGDVASKVWIKWAASVSSSFFLQWKSDESTKHYLNKMLLAINWRYWQTRKNFTHTHEGSRSPRASTLHWNPPGFRKRKKVLYFSNRSLCIGKLYIYIYKRCINKEERVRHLPGYCP